MKLKVLTPVHIGSGEKISNLEYIIKNNEFLFYSFDDTIKEILNYDNFQNIAYELKEGIEKIIEKYNINLKPTYKIPFKSQSKEKDVYEFIKSRNKVYIPGSTIKGAIRTCYFYYKLKNDANLRNNFLNDLRRTRKDELKKLALEYENKIFRNNSNNIRNDIFKNVLVSDSDLYEPESSLEVIEIYKGNLSLNLEVLRKNFIFEVKIKINDKNLEDEIKKSIIEFSNDLVNYLRSETKYNLELILNKRVLRIGKYKGYFSNTIMLIVYMFDRDLYSKFKKKTFWRTITNEPLGFCEILW